MLNYNFWIPVRIISVILILAFIILLITFYLNWLHDGEDWESYNRNGKKYAFSAFAMAGIVILLTGYIPAILEWFR